MAQNDPSQAGEVLSGEEGSSMLKTLGLIAIIALSVVVSLLFLVLPPVSVQPNSVYQKF